MQVRVSAVVVKRVTKLGVEKVWLDFRTKQRIVRSSPVTQPKQEQEVKRRKSGEELRRKPQEQIRRTKSEEQIIRIGNQSEEITKKLEKKKSEGKYEQHPEQSPRVTNETNTARAIKVFLRVTFSTTAYLPGPCRSPTPSCARPTPSRGRRIGSAGWTRAGSQTPPLALRGGNKKITTKV